jgi:hypothetical protein
VPDDAPPAWTRWSLDGHPAMTLELRPSARPVRVRLLVPEALAARGAVRVGLATTTWRDPRQGGEHGLHVGAQWVLAERLPTPAAIEAAIARTAADRLAEESYDYGWWHAAESLYVPQRVRRAALPIGPGDDAQLGPGWYHREQWGRLGFVRWTGPEAVAYLAAPGGAGHASIRAYSGEPKLGPVTGRLVAEHAPPDGPFTASGEAPFDLAADSWTELGVPVPVAPGTVRVTIRVDAPRVPRDRIPGSQDTRPLGLAVTGLRLR